MFDFSDIALKENHTNLKKMKMHHLLKKYVGVNISVYDIKNNLSLQSQANNVNIVSNPQNNANYCVICHSNWIQPVEINSTYPTYNDPFPTTGNSSTDFIDQWLSNPISIVSPAPVVVETPAEPINNVQKFLECLNLSQGAELTIYVEQPKPNTDNVIYMGNVGHTFISIQQNNQIKVFGFYLGANLTTPVKPSSEGSYGDDSNHVYHTSVSVNITSTQLQNIINYICNNTATYNLNSYNCTDFAIVVSNLAGLNLPDSYGSWLGGGGSNPGVLGQYIRGLQGSVKSNSDLNAPISTKCN